MKSKAIKPILISILISLSMTACNSGGSQQNEEMVKLHNTQKIVNKQFHFSSQKEIESKLVHAASIVNKSITHSPTGLLDRSLNLLKEKGISRNDLTGQEDSLGTLINRNLKNDKTRERPIIDIVDDFIIAHDLTLDTKTRDSLYAYSKSIDDMIIANLSMDINHPLTNLTEYIFGRVAVCQNFAQFIYAYLSNEPGFEDMSAVPIKIRDSKAGDHVAIAITIPYADSSVSYVIDPWLPYVLVDGEVISDSKHSRYDDNHSIIKQTLNQSIDGTYLDTFIGPVVAYFIHMQQFFPLDDSQATASGIQTLELLKSLSTMNKKDKHDLMKKLWSQSGNISGIDIDDKEGLNDVRETLIFASEHAAN